ncbi:MAG TPA: multicopper oxidase domain-containing protein, partial [Bryobacteraceae bacterium]|nr:multicopper oxidase domain-containing protein [Bryobacteraceae bacterium]
MERRDFIKTAALVATGGRFKRNEGQPAAGDLCIPPAALHGSRGPDLAFAPGPQEHQSFLAPAAAPDVAKTDFNLRIAPVTVELAPNRIVSTIGYNGTSPGPLLRMKEGAQVTVHVTNDTDVPEYVHFHGLLIPSDVDGSEEEGTPPVPPHGNRSYTFKAEPAGTRWYHTHVMSMDDLHRGTFTGQFGFLVIEGGGDPGHYDQEHYLALRDWEPYFTKTPMDTDDLDPIRSQPERPAVLDTRPGGLEVTSDIYSINDKA